MPVSSVHLVRHYESNSAAAVGVILKTGALHQSIGLAVVLVRQERAAALLALAVAYLPALEAQVLERAEQLTGFRGFTRRDPLQALAHQTAMLRKQVIRVQGDERYTRRQFLVGPHGELTRELAERQSLLEPWVADCERFESLEGFQDLIASRYDTPDFDVSWLSARYWKLWAAGDRICEALGMGDFGDEVLPAYQKVAAQRLRWLAQVQEVQEQVDAVHTLVQQHDQAVARIPRLPEEVLQASQQALAQHLEHADLGLLEQWLGEEPDRAMLLALRRAAGLGAKAEFLAELESGLAAQMAALRERKAKFDRKAQKFARSKYVGTSWPETNMDPGFAEKSVKMRSSLNKTESLVERMLRYDRYERFSLANDPELWWVEFTQKRPPRSAPRLHAWYLRNPGVAPNLDVDDQDAQAVAAAIAAQSDADDLGYVS